MAWCRPGQDIPETGDEKPTLPVEVRDYTESAGSIFPFYRVSDIISGRTTSLCDDGNTEVPENEREYTLQENREKKT